MTWTPGKLPNLEVWLDADDASTITDSAGNVTQWDDKSPNAYTFSPITNGPATGSTTQNGKNTLDFDDSNSEALESDQAASNFSFLSDDGVSYVFAVIKAGNSATPDKLMMPIATGRNSSGIRGFNWAHDDRSSLGFSDKFRHFSSAGVSSAEVDNASANGAWPANEYILASTRTDETASPAADRGEIRVNAGTPIKNNTSTSNNADGAPASPLRIGVDSSSTFYFEGQVAEVLAFSSDLSEVDRQAVEGYLAHKWGLTAELPADHPYKTTAPAGLGAYPEDPLYSDVTLLLPMQGYDGSTTFDVFGSTLGSVTPNGSAKILTNQSKYGISSAYFDGSDTVTLPSDGLPNGSGDFCVEMWVRPNTSVANKVLLDARPTGTNGNYFTMVHLSTNAIRININSTAVLEGSAGEVPDGTWTHVAVERSGGTIKLYIDGVESDSASNSTNLLTTKPRLGGTGVAGAGTADFVGWIEDYRYTSAARYKADFTPPTRPHYVETPTDANASDVTLLLPFDGQDGDTAATDRSATGAALTFNADAQLSVDESRYYAASLLLDGTGDYISVDYTPDVQDSWTFECWVRLDSLAANQDIFSTRPVAGGTAQNNGFSITISSSGNLICFGWDGSTYRQKDATGVTISTGQWYYITVCYDGTTMRFFVNGEAKGTEAHTSTHFTNTSVCYIGVLASARHLSGRISDLRWTQGVSRYSSSFSLPAYPLYEAVTDTTAPTLTSATGSATGATTLDASVSTDESGGTLYWVVSTSATAPSVAQVQAGQDHTGSAAVDSGSQAVGVIGTQNIGATGLTASTGYYVHFQQDDAAGNASTVVTTAQITTDAAGPTIDTQPTNQTVDENTTATFTVAASGTGTLTYQWQEDSGAGFGDISGETAATLDFTAVEADDGNSYRCVVTDDNGSTNSSAATLTVTALTPTIDTQPQNTTVGENTVASFTVAATASAGSLSYQWYDAGDDSALSGETSATLSFTAQEADTGNTYYVIVTDSNGSTQSNTVTLTVTALTPTISGQPQDDTVDVGETASFTVSATASAGSLSYQWYDASDDSALTGETQATLSLTTSLSDNGNTYYVVVTDSNGSVQSSTVTLTVEANAVTILVDPQTQAIFDHTQVTLEVSATGVGPLAYQWYDASDDSAIAGATKSKLVVDAAISVYCRVTDEAGTSSDSETAVITVISPSLDDQTTQPAAQELPGPGPTRTSKQDWAAMVAAVEKQSVEVDDYRFSGRTFRRRDRLLNPKT